MLCIIESDLHGVDSRIKRNNSFTSNEIKEILNIPGYNLILPKSWDVHSQARLLLFVHEKIQIKIRDNSRNNSDLPMITCDISLGKEKKTIVNFFYREFKSGVSGLNNKNSQIERLKRMAQIWTNLSKENRDLICMGDANVCNKLWNVDNYHLNDYINMINKFLLDSSCQQIIKEYTRFEKN